MKLTLGGKGSEEDWPYQGSIDAAASFGNQMVEVDIDGSIHDEENRIVTAPAYMKGTATPAQIYHNIKSMVDTVAQQVKEHPDADQALAIYMTVEIKQDRIHEFKNMLAYNSLQTRLEPGCYRFDMLQDESDPCKFHFYEVYKNKAALDEHMKTKHYDGWAQLKDSGAVISQSVQMSKPLFFGY